MPSRKSAVNCPTCTCPNKTSDQRGATAIEYALIAAGIAAAIVTTVFVIGDDVLNNMYQTIADLLEDNI